MRLSVLPRLVTCRSRHYGCTLAKGLRQDVAQHFADHVLELTAQVLTRHGQSPEQVEAILREIRNGTGSYQQTLYTCIARKWSALGQPIDRAHPVFLSNEQDDIKELPSRS